MKEYFSDFTRWAASLQDISWIHFFSETFFSPGWWQLLLCFLSCSIIMINRLNAIEKNGFQGALIGTLIMPYFSGFPNLCFAWLIFKAGTGGAVVMENCMVNNITNLTLILALPCLFSGLNLKRSAHLGETDLKINRLSLVLSILAMIFFAFFVLLLSKDGQINRMDGMMLVGLFLFWQVYQIFDLLKNNTRTSARIKKRILFDLALIGLCAWGIFSSLDQLLAWISAGNGPDFILKRLGFFSGILMVIPNAFLAVYYALVKRNEIAYSSQIGDCHICIPLCIGIFAVLSAIRMTDHFELLLWILIGTSGIHFLFTAFLGRLPRMAGLGLLGLYAFFLYQQMI